MRVQKFVISPRFRKSSNKDIKKAYETPFIDLKFCKL